MKRPLIRQKVWIQLSANPVHLCVLRRLVAEACRWAGFTVRHRRRLMLAVDEAAANIIRHAYHGKPNGRIEIVLDPARHRSIRIVLRDDAPRCEFKAFRGRALADVRPGGLGLHFIRTAFDRVKFSHPRGSGNQIEMVKRV